MKLVDIRIKKLNASHCRVLASPAITEELWERYTFDAPNAKFDKRYKKKKWDGKIRLFNKLQRTIYVGLVDNVKQYAREKGYSLSSEYDDSAEFGDTKPFYLSNLAPGMVSAEDQIELLQLAVNQQRATVIAPTGSGKSFLIYLLTKYWDKKTLIICPSINLINQAMTDFRSYSEEFVDQCGKVMEGIDPYGVAECSNVVISTWQSLALVDREYFLQFETVVVDECHGAKAKTITGILENCINAYHRYGFTGTTDDIEIHDLALEGLFGPFLQNRTTMELVDEGRLAKPKIRCVILEYPREDRKVLWSAMLRLPRDKRYNVEARWLTLHQKRQEILEKLILSIKGSCFVLFRNIAHGKHIYKNLSKVRTCELVYGEVDGDRREEIRIESNLDPNSCTVASYGVFSTGVNVPNLKNVVFASPYKSKIKVLQSIGRVVRKTATKSKVYVIDVIDDLTLGRRGINYAVKHFIARCKLYEAENFEYEVIRIPLNGKKT